MFLATKADNRLPEVKEMFKDEIDLDELDFRFEPFFDSDQFLFVHHGMNLYDFANIIDLEVLGSSFIMAELRLPFELQKIVNNIGMFQNKYGVSPKVIYKKYLLFSREELKQFFINTKEDDELDCNILGINDGKYISEDSLSRVRLEIRGKTPYLDHYWVQSHLGVHDNHFFHLASRSIALLRRLIEESIIGFFYQIAPQAYGQLPSQLIDLIMTQYNTASIFCDPTKYDEETKKTMVSDNIGVNKQCVAIFATTIVDHPSWTSYNLKIPENLLDRKLEIAYDIGKKEWSWKSQI